jgi:hypothetical protein
LLIQLHGLESARVAIDHQMAALDSEQCNQQSTAGAINNQQSAINNLANA